MQAVRAKVIRHTSFSLAAQILHTFAGFFLTAYLARYLGVARYSEYSLALSFVVIFLAFANWGISDIAVREIARFPGRIRETLSAVFSMRVVLGVLSWIACILSAIWAGYAPSVRQAIWAYSFLLLVTPLQTVSLVNQVKFRADLGLLASLVGRVVLVVGTVAAVRAGFGLNALMAIAVVTLVIEAVLNGMLIGHLNDLRFRWNATLWMFLGREAFPIGVAGVLTTILMRFDVILLSKLSGLDAVGIYAAPFRIVYFLGFIPQAVMASFYPLVAAYRQTQPEKVQRLYHRTVELLAFLALPMAVGGTVLAPRLIPLIFGAAFQPSVPVFQLLVWQMAMVYVAIVPATLLVAHGLQGLNLRLLVVPVLLSVGINAVFIPLYGARAAAWASLVAHGTLAVTTVIVARRRLQVTFRWGILGTHAVNAGVMGIIAWVLRSQSVFLVIPLVMLIYVGMAGAQGVWRQVRAGRHPPHHGGVPLGDRDARRVR